MAIYMDISKASAGISLSDTKGKSLKGWISHIVVTPDNHWKAAPLNYLGHSLLYRLGGLHQISGEDIEISYVTDVGIVLQALSYPCMQV